LFLLNPAFGELVWHNKREYPRGGLNWTMGKGTMTVPKYHDDSRSNGTIEVYLGRYQPGKAPPHHLSFTTVDTVWHRKHHFLIISLH